METIQLTQRYQHNNKMIRLFLYLIVVLLIACNNNPKLDCSDKDTKEITFVSDSVGLRLPAAWTKIDTTSFYDKAGIYNRKIMNNDTSDFALLSVSDYSVYADVQINEADFFLKMKAKMNESNNGKDSLIDDVTKEINGHRVNFLKYLQVGNKTKIYDAHIGFVLPEKKQVEIQIRTSNTDGLRMLDCIFASLKVK
jgi:hypothetical protein